MGKIDYGQAYRALLNSSSECGDVGLVEFYGDYCVAALIDGLGHGIAARKAALCAADYIRQNIDSPVNVILRGMHEYIKGTRGAVAAVCKINTESGQTVYSGIGNISIKLLGDEYTNFVSKDGVIGYVISTPVETKLRIKEGDILVFHSDGIKGHFNFENKIEWESMPAQMIAKAILGKYKSDNDDASCIVIKYS